MNKYNAGENISFNFIYMSTMHKHIYTYNSSTSQCTHLQNNKQHGEQMNEKNTYIH